MSKQIGQDYHQYLESEARPSKVMVRVRPDGSGGSTIVVDATPESSSFSKRHEQKQDQGAWWENPAN